MPGQVFRRSEELVAHPALDLALVIVLGGRSLLVDLRRLDGLLRVLAGVAATELGLVVGGRRQVGRVVLLQVVL